MLKYVCSTVRPYQYEFQRM